MASPQMGSAPTKLSFARVVAMPAPLPPQKSSNTSNEKSRVNENASARNLQSPKPVDLALPSTTKIGSSPKSGSTNGVNQLAGAIQGLALVKDAKSNENDQKTNPSTDSTEDDQSHLSNTSSKPQSFDTKSLASVTTFAMDEKESIRPDDSASVRAAEDDDFVHGPQYGPGLVQMTSEQAAMAARANPRFLPQSSLAARRYPTLTMANQPRFGDLPLSPISPSSEHQPTTVPLISEETILQEDHRPVGILAISPDEKLLEALASPKDRLPLLQLEEKVIAFVSQERDQVLDFPPQNAFARLLAHKLADYYCLQHQMNDDTSSVRMFKTHLRNLPTPLHVIAQSILTGPPAPPGSAAFKIMRRTAFGGRHFSAGQSTPASSSVPSKATSETGGDNSDEGLTSPIDGTSMKDRSKMTREEREASYKAARERIFGDYQNEPIINEGGSNGETSADMSRSSSSSGKKKTHRQRAPKDDSFEARSSYVPYHGIPMHPVQGQIAQYQEPQIMNHFASGPLSSNVNFNVSPQYTLDSPNAYGNLMSLSSGGPQVFNASDMWQSAQPNGYNPYGHLNAQPSQAMNQNPHSMHQMAMHNQYLPQNGLNFPQPMQNWPQTQFQSTFPAQPPPQWSQFAAQSPNQPYQYGQLPPQAYANHATYNAQHPVPGSYTRSLFNPQTRSFVPSNSPGRPGGKTSRKKHNTSPGLVRAGSSNHSAASEGASAGLPSKASSPMPREDSLQQKYGAPPNLPKKPPAPQVSFEIEGAAIPPPPPQASQHRCSPVAPLVVNGAPL